MCDALKEDDERYKLASKLIEQDGCKSVNDQLSTCLKAHKKDWRFCKQETALLQECLQKKKNQVQQQS